jgi:hypothetical protein
MDGVSAFAVRHCGDFQAEGLVDCRELSAPADVGAAAPMPAVRAGRHSIPQEHQGLIRRMAFENRLWGQKRIQAELARLGFKVSART